MVQTLRRWICQEDGCEATVSSYSQATYDNFIALHIASHAIAESATQPKPERKTKRIAEEG